MQKIIKRIKKSTYVFDSALVIGTAFGCLEDLYDIYGTVFVLDTEHPGHKKRNLVYLMPSTSFDNLSTISTVFIDEAFTGSISKLATVFMKHSPVVLIEGNEVIDRSKSKSLYAHGYRARKQCGYYHIWKKN